MGSEWTISSGGRDCGVVLGLVGVPMAVSGAE